MSASLSLVGQSVFVLVATVSEQPDLHIVIEDRLSSRFTSNSRDSGENNRNSHCKKHTDTVEKGTFCNNNNKKAISSHLKHN